MAVFMKSANYAFLKKIGVPDVYVEALTHHQVKLAIGFFDLKFTKENGEELSGYHLAKSTNDLMKGLVAPTVLEGIKGGVINAINEALFKLGMQAGELEKLKQGFQEAEKATKELAEVTTDLGTLLKNKLASDKKKSPSQEFMEAMEQANKKDQAPLPPNTTIPIPANISSLLQAPTVKLSEATMMYQPVKGSSPHSRYFVVAIAPKFKVAARVKSDGVSVRVEGVLTPQEKMAFESVNLTTHEHYLSGHFECGGKVTPERVLGAVLLGTGLQFSSPLPSATMIKNKGE